MKIVVMKGGKGSLRRANFAIAVNMTVKDDISREFRRRLIADLLSTSLHRTMRVSLSF